MRTQIISTRTSTKPPPLRLGIFGGAFNPIHAGHLLLAETAREQLRLDRVWFVPTGRSPHKPNQGLLPAEHRLAMIRLALRGNPALRVSACELARPGPSYTVDTLRHFTRRYHGARLFLLIGEDNLRAEWKDWEEVARLADVVVYNRPGASAQNDPRGVRRLAMPAMDLSSSDIRRRVRRGLSVRYRVPAAVARYIDARGLYR